LKIWAATKSRFASIEKMGDKFLFAFIEEMGDKFVFVFIEEMDDNLWENYYQTKGNAG
jgi:hypothetical protein